MQWTEATINALTREAARLGKQIERRDHRAPGLELRVSKTGVQTWALRCRDRSGRLRSFTLGHYPEMGLADARVAVRQTRAAVESGADPTAERKAEREPKPPDAEPDNSGRATLRDALAIYEAQRGADLKSWAHSRKRVDRVFAALMAQPIAALTAIDLQTAADRYPARQSGAFAVRTLRPALKWLTKRGLAPKGLADIEQPVTVNRRRRVLHRDELARLLPVLAPADRPYPAFLRFLLLTLARREEAAAARWRDIDFDRKLWLIPETKNGEPHEVPLSRQGLALLRRLGPGAPDALLFATAGGKPLGNWDRETKRLMQASDTAGWHRHDLRRTGATLLGEMGELPHVIEAALNHIAAVGSPLAALYNRSRYRPQVALALQRLADAYDGIVAGAGVVIPLAIAGERV
jgi:integrase